MRKLKVVQIGIRHEHAKGKYKTLKKLPDAFELAGIVDEAEFAHTPTYLSPEDATFATYAGEKFITLDEVFAMPDLDAVLIEVPNLDLVPVAMRFAERGIPMHVDKPCGEDLAAYKRLLDLAESKKLPFQMGYVFRYNPAVRFAVDAVKSGMLGHVFMVETNMNHCYGGEAYQKYLTAFKGGVMFNLGCHLIDILVEMLGRPDEVVSLLKGCKPVVFEGVGVLPPVEFENDRFAAAERGEFAPVSRGGTVAPRGGHGESAAVPAVDPQPPQGVLRRSAAQGKSVLPGSGDIDGPVDEMPLVIPMGNAFAADARFVAADHDRTALLRSKILRFDMDVGADGTTGAAAEEKNGGGETGKYLLFHSGSLLVKNPILPPAKAK